MTVTVTGLDALAQNLDRLGAQAGQGLADAVLHAGRAIVKPVAQEKCPVSNRLATADDPHMRDTIDAVLVESTPTYAAIEVGTPKDYGPPVEFGTSKAAAQPFLRPALDASEDQVRQVITAAMLTALGAG
jgi:HK97 gp10 family phage protein